LSRYEIPVDTFNIKNAQSVFIVMHTSNAARKLVGTPIGEVDLEFGDRLHLDRQPLTLGENIRDARHRPLKDPNWTTDLSIKFEGIDVYELHYEKVTWGIAGLDVLIINVKPELSPRQLTKIAVFNDPARDEEPEPSDPCIQRSS